MNSPLPDFSLLMQHTVNIANTPINELKKIEKAILDGDFETVRQIEQKHTFQPASNTITSFEELVQQGDSDYYASQKFFYQLATIDTAANRARVTRLKEDIQMALQNRCAPNTAHFVRDMHIGFATVESFFLLIAPYYNFATIRNTCPKFRLQARKGKSRKVGFHFSKNKRSNKNMFPTMQTSDWHKWKLILPKNEERHIDIRTLTLAYNYYTHDVTVSATYYVWAKSELGWSQVP